VLGALRYVDEVVVADDGSIDNTARIAEAAGAKVLRHKVNRGYGAAIQTCLAYARNNGAGVLVVLDGDGQHRPDSIPRVVNPILQGEADICIGSRFLEQGHADKIPRYRRLGIGLITGLSNSHTRRSGRLKDTQSGFRAYSRNAIEMIDPVEVGMGASVEVLWDADRHGLRVVEVPMEVDYDVEGSTRGPLHHGLSVIGSMISYVETEHALLFFGVPGLTSFVVGIILGGLVIDRFNHDLVLPLGLALLSSLLVVSGLLLGFTGLILHAVINATRRFR
jgi:glycosyltransferase involved in cell wall biosynthesis